MLNNITHILQKLIFSYCIEHNLGKRIKPNLNKNKKYY